MSHAYQAFYCEENVWQLLHEPELAARRREALFIGNAGKQVALWQQRVAHPDPVIWDYHVVALIDRAVWDLDTVLPVPCPLAEWLAATFLPLAAEHAAFAPRFRLVELADLERTFASDRRHMKRARGWIKPPPPWPPPGRGHTLDRYLDLDDPIAGRVLGLDELRALTDARSAGGGGR